MATKKIKNGRIRWVGRVQKNGQVIQKIFDTKAETLTWEEEQRRREWAETTDTACSLLDWATKYLDFAQAKFDVKTYTGKRKAFQELFAATAGSGKKRIPILDPHAPVTTLTPGKVLAAFQESYKKRTGNAVNKDRKNLVAAWHWGMRYLGMPGPNPQDENGVGCR